MDLPSRYSQDFTMDFLENFSINLFGYPAKPEIPLGFCSGFFSGNSFRNSCTDPCKNFYGNISRNSTWNFSKSHSKILSLDSCGDSSWNSSRDLSINSYRDSYQFFVFFFRSPTGIAMLLLLATVLPPRLPGVA